jgi:hypothetical protein
MLRRGRCTTPQPALHHRRDKVVKEKWLVISNCQTLGLANCLALLCPHADVDMCDIWLFQDGADTWRTKILEYDQLIINPEIQGLGLVDFSTLSNVIWVPALSFRAFHPDLQNVFHAGQSVKTPMDDYHSVIVFAAYKLGLDEKDTAALFRRDVYEDLGFFSIWDDEKQCLLTSFAKYGLDVRPEFVNWMRQGPFMHSMNHPKIHALYDLAVKVACKIPGAVIVRTDFAPQDNLVAASVYPVYPEIADRYGVGRGSKVFKVAYSYKVISLEEFISGSFSAYRSFEAEDLQGNSPHFDRAIQLIMAAA